VLDPSSKSGTKYYICENFIILNENSKYFNFFLNFHDIKRSGLYTIKVVKFQMVEMRLVSRLKFEKILMFSVFFIISTTLLTTFPMAFADNVQDSINDGTTITKLPGESFTTRYFVTASSNQGTSDPAGCNIGTVPGEVATVTLTIVATSGSINTLTYTPNPIRISNCQNGGGVDVTFTSAVAGRYQISAVTTDADGNTYQTNGSFVLEFFDPRHRVGILFDPVQAPLPLAKFTISGYAVDLDQNNEGISGLLLNLAVQGEQSPADFPNPTTGGITFNAVTGTINDQGSYWVFPNGATISLPKPKVVTIEVKTVDGGNVNFKLYPDASNPSAFTLLSIQGIGANGISKSASSPSGFEKIEVLPPTGGGANNISRITIASGNGITILDIVPTASGSFETKTFGGGRFISEGFAQSAEASGQLITASFAGSINYRPDSGQTTYDIIGGPQTLAGFGGLESVIGDRGTGRTMQTCTTDTDGDGACDLQEGTCSTCGIPFVVGTTTYYYKLPGSNPTTKQIWVEHDATNYHVPLATTLAGVATPFTSNGITLINTISDTIGTIPGGTTLAHPVNINIWQEVTPTTLMTQRIDSFNEIKADWFGTTGEKVVLGGTSSFTLGTQSGTVAPFTRTLTINPGSNDNNVEVPVAPPALPTATTAGVSTSAGVGTGGATQGFIIYTIKLAPAPSQALSAGTPTITTTTGTMSFYASPTLELSAYSNGIPYQILTVKIPFRTTGTVTTAVNIPQVAIPITYSTTTTGFTPTQLSPSPSYTTTLLDAKAYVYRYALWGHCPQAAGCGSSGQAEANGNDIFISLGQGFGGTNPSGHTTTGWSTGSVQEQQGTYMHELGHTLNLLHGGPATWISTLPAPTGLGNDNGQNCKPNYFSVMSYARQMNNYLTAASGPTAWSPVYSTGGHPPLIENSLLENMGASLLAGAVYGPAIVESPTNDPSNDYRIMAGTETYIDWNRNGINGVSTPTSANVNMLNIAGCNANTPADVFDSTKPLRDYNDWANLKLTFSPSAGTYDGFTPFFSEATGGQRIQIIFATSNYDLITPTTAHSQWGWSSTLNIKFKIVDANGAVIQVPGVYADVYRAKVVNGVPEAFSLVGTGGYSNNDQTITVPVKFLKAEQGATFQFKVFAVNPFITSNQELVRDSIPPSTAPAGISFDVTIN